MEATYDNEAWTLTRVNGETACTITKPDSPSKGMFMCKVPIRTHAGTIILKTFNSHLDIIIGDNAGMPIPVISLSQHMTVFTSPMLKPNLSFASAPVVPRPRVPRAPPALTSHVAKQLFDLAVIRKEQCPITMDTFTVGNTAVMPCGHLFMKMAIEESFKKDPHRCPWCRQNGGVTFV